MPGRWFNWFSRREAPPAPVPPPPARPRPPNLDLPHAQRRSWAQLTHLLGPAPAGAVAQLGLELCRAALLEPGPRRLDEQSSRSLFVTETFGVAAMEGGSFVNALSPEEIRGVPTDERSDVYVACLALYELCLGEQAIPGENDVQYLQNALAQAFRPLGEQVPQALREVLKRGLSLEPPGRFASLQALAEALEQTRLASPTALRTWLTGVNLAIARPAVVETPPQSTAEHLLARIAEGDETARLVYADHLEAEGRLAEATWLRIEHRLRQTPREKQLPVLMELRAVKVSDAFLGSVARTELEGCGVQFGFRCPRTWNALRETADPLVRWCSACDEAVTLAKSVDDAVAIGSLGHCVALAPDVERPETPLHAPQGHTLGRAPRRAFRRRR